MFLALQHFLAFLRLSTFMLASNEVGWSEGQISIDLHDCLNTTNGSWWMVQVLSTQKSRTIFCAANELEQ
jgi:hypothetical protein